MWYPVIRALTEPFNCLDGKNVKKLKEQLTKGREECMDHGRFDFGAAAHLGAASEVDAESPSGRATMWRPKNDANKSL